MGRGTPVEVVVAAVESTDTAQAVAEQLGVDASTVRAWRRGRLPLVARHVLDGGRRCPTCGAPAHDLDGLDAATYAGLLGYYLGDGCLAALPRSGHLLRITLDHAYPAVVEDARAVVAAVRGRPAAARARADNAVDVSSGWRSLAFLLPQHGPGRKHERAIVLEPWQERHVEAAPTAFVRGLLHTDGWRGMNAVVSKGRRYAYPRYQFSNRSDDIRALFTAALDDLGVAWRPWGRWHVSVARREAVAALDAFVGPKEAPAPPPWGAR